MVESEFERLGKTVNLMLERFSRLTEERNDLVTRLERTEQTAVGLRRQVEDLSSRKDQVRGRIDGLIARLGKLEP